jgi:ABC-type phosphate transport system substrate-binding protein
MKSLISAVLVVASLLFLADICPLEAQGNYPFKVIVNNDNPISAATKSEVSKWFLKKSTSWSTGGAIKAVDQAADSGVRADFTNAIHGKSVNAIKSYWQKKIFSGAGTPPPEVGSDAEVLSYVKSNPGAIGYVSATADVGGVKVLDIND